MFDVSLDKGNRLCRTLKSIEAMNPSPNLCEVTEAPCSGKLVNRTRQHLPGSDLQFKATTGNNSARPPCQWPGKSFPFPLSPSICFCPDWLVVCGCSSRASLSYNITHPVITFWSGWRSVECAGKRKYVPVTETR